MHALPLDGPFSHQASQAFRVYVDSHEKHHEELAFGTRA